MALAAVDDSAWLRPAVRYLLYPTFKGTSFEYDELLKQQSCSGIVLGKILEVGQVEPAAQPKALMPRNKKARTYLRILCRPLPKNPDNTALVLVNRPPTRSRLRWSSPRHQEWRPEPPRITLSQNLGAKSP